MRQHPGLGIERLDLCALVEIDAVIVRRDDRGERGAEHEKEVARACFICGAQHLCFRHRLAEGDIRGFQKTAAVRNLIASGKVSNDLQDRALAAAEQAPKRKQDVTYLDTILAEVG